MDRTDRPGELNISLVHETCIVNRHYYTSIVNRHRALQQQSEGQDIQIRDLKKAICAQQELMCTLQASVTAGKEALEMEHIEKNKMAQHITDMHEVLLRREEETDKLKQNSVY